MKTDIEAWCDRCAGALFDGGYQGLIVVAVIWAALKWTPNVNAATRYAAWMATLLVIAVLPAVHFFMPRAQSEALPVVEVEEPILEDSIATPNEEVSVWVGAAVEHAPEPAALETGLAPASTPAPVWELSIPKYTSAALMGGWALLAFVRLGGLAHQLFVLRGFRRRAVPVGAALAAQFLTLARRMRVEQPTSLLISSELDVPMVAGFLKPAILLPQNFTEEASARQMEHVLRHELAHVARRDDWANLLQQMMAAIFFFHPGVWVVSRRLTVEREIACDDHALAAMGAPRDYALFLTEFATRARGRDWTAAPAAWSNKSQLKERIVMILDGKRNASPRLARARAAGMALGAAALAALALQMGPRLVLAGEAENASAEPKEKAEPAAAVVSVEAAPEAPVLVAVPAVGPAPRALVAVSAPVKVAVPPIGALPATPKPPRAVVAMTEPGPAPEPSSDRRNRSQDSIERRLDRLERMVESLVGHEKDKTVGKPGLSEDDEKKIHKMAEEHAKMAEKMAKMQNGDEWGRMREELQKETERARRDIERAGRETERAAREAARATEERGRADAQRNRAEQERNLAENQGRDRDGLKARRSALEAQRRAIEKQIQEVERQMEREDREKSSDKDKEKEKNKNKDNTSNDKQ